MAYRAGWLLALGIADAMLVWADAPPALKAAALALLVFLLPGVAALAALFPERDQLDGWERLGIGGAAGLALSMQAAWLAMLVPGGMDMPVLLVILNAVTLGLGIAALWRMARLPARRRVPACRGVVRFG